MGHKRKIKDKIKEEKGSETEKEPGRIKSWINKKKEQAGDLFDRAMDNITAHAQKGYYKRWREKSGCNSAVNINWDDPQISLEAKLCDPRNLKLLRGGKHRDEFFKLCSEEEIYLYLNEKGPKGELYTDVENPKFLREMVKGTRIRWKEERRKKGQKMTPEEEKALDSLLLDDDDNGTEETS